MANGLILNDLLDKLNLSVNAFEGEIDSGVSSVAKVIRENKHITKNLIKKILTKYPDVNEKWLETGEGEMLKPAPGSDVDPAEPTAADLAAGENIEDGDRVDSFIARHYTPVGLAALYVLGQAYSTPLDKADLDKMLKDQPTRIKLIYTDIKMIYEMDNGHISWTKQQSVQPEPEKVKT